MEFADIKNKGVNDLRDLLVEKRNEWRELKFKAAAGQLKNVRTLRIVKKTIARILTLLNQPTKKV